MKKSNFEAPVMELINIGAEDIICTSGDPRFVLGVDAPTAGQQDFDDMTLYNY